MQVEKNLKRYNKTGLIKIRCQEIILYRKVWQKFPFAKVVGLIENNNGVVEKRKSTYQRHSWYCKKRQILLSCFGAELLLKTGLSMSSSSIVVEISKRHGNINTCCCIGTLLTLIQLHLNSVERFLGFLQLQDFHTETPTPHRAMIRVSSRFMHAVLQKESCSLVC